MHLSKTGKFFIGFFTILQLFVGLFFFVWLFGQFLPIILSDGGQHVEHMIFDSIAGILIWMILIGMLGLGLLIFYVVHAATNPNLSTTMKLVWVILLFFFGAIAEVVYFFMEIGPANSMTARLDTL